MTDTYTVTGTDGNSCQNTATVTVTVNALPTVTLALPMDTACQNGGTLSLSGESPAGGSWNGPGVTGSSFDPIASGLGMIAVTYTYTDANGCSNAANDSIWVDLCSGIEAAQPGMVTEVFPNPTSGNLTIRCTEAAVAPVTVEITDAVGRVAMSFTMTTSSQDVDLASLQNGVYFVRMIKGNTVAVQRIVKQ